MAATIRVVADGFDLYRLATPGSVKIAPQVIDAKSTGRTASTAEMHREIVGDKDQIEMSFPSLCQADCQRIVQMAYKKFVPVDYISPGRGERYEVYFYVKIDAPSLELPKFLPRTGRREPWTWDGLKVTLTEK